MRRPRVVQVAPDPSRPGGMAAVVTDLLASPLASQYQFDLIVTYDSRARLRRALVFVRALGRLLRWCRGEGDRLVHIHTAVRGSIYRKALCVVVASAAGRPVLLQLHAGAGDIETFAGRIGTVRRWLLRRALRRADAVVSVSTPGARQIEERLGAHKVIVIPNAAPRARQTRRARSSSDHRPTALYMGGFVAAAKGGAVLVEALPSLLERSPDLKVVLAGTGEPPPAFAAIQREYGDRLEWAGWLDAEAKAEQLSNCDLFVMPSLSEGMPVALLEAMAYGCAIVASDTGGIPDVVAAESEAILIPPADTEALSEAIALAATDPQLRARIGRAARERVKEYDPDMVYRRLAAVYDELLGQHGTQR